jgi:hypothetical protein
MPIAYIWSISVTWLVASRPATKFLASSVAGRPQGSTPSIEGRRATTQMDASPYLLSHSEKIAALCPTVVVSVCRCARGSIFALTKIPKFAAEPQLLRHEVKRAIPRAPFGRTKDQARFRTSAPLTNVSLRRPPELQRDGSPCGWDPGGRICAAAGLPIEKKFRSQSEKAFQQEWRRRETKTSKA